MECAHFGSEEPSPPSPSPLLKVCVLGLLLLSSFVVAVVVVVVIVVVVVVVIVVVVVVDVVIVVVVVVVVVFFTIFDSLFAAWANVFFSKDSRFR